MEVVGEFKTVEQLNKMMDLTFVSTLTHHHHVGLSNYRIGDAESLIRKCTSRQLRKGEL